MMMGNITLLESQFHAVVLKVALEVRYTFRIHSITLSCAPIHLLIWHGNRSDYRMHLKGLIWPRNNESPVTINEEFVKSTYKWPPCHQIKSVLLLSSLTVLSLSSAATTRSRIVCIISSAVKGSLCI